VQRTEYVIKNPNRCKTEHSPPVKDPRRPYFPCLARVYNSASHPSFPTHQPILNFPNIATTFLQQPTFCFAISQWLLWMMIPFLLCWIRARTQLLPPFFVHPVLDILTNTGGSPMDSIPSDERFVNIDEDSLFPVSVDVNGPFETNETTGNPSGNESRQLSVAKKYTPRKPRQKLYKFNSSQANNSHRINQKTIIVGNNKVGKVGKLRCGLCRKRNSKVVAPLLTCD
jgi:hypothetical protein